MKPPVGARVVVVRALNQRDTTGVVALPVGTTGKVLKHVDPRDWPRLGAGSVVFQPDDVAVFGSEAAWRTASVLPDYMLGELPKMHTCPLCPNETDTSLCASCASDLADLGVTDLPAPDATADEVRAWALAHGVSVFSCRKADITP